MIHIYLCFYNKEFDSSPVCPRVLSDTNMNPVCIQRKLFQKKVQTFVRPENLQIRIKCKNKFRESKVRSEINLTPNWGEKTDWGHFEKLTSYLPQEAEAVLVFKKQHIRDFDSWKSETKTEARWLNSGGLWLLYFWCWCSVWQVRIQNCMITLLLLISSFRPRAPCFVFVACWVYWTLGNQNWDTFKLWLLLK